MSRALLTLLATLALSIAPSAAQARLPRIGHVAVIVLENEDAETTFAPRSPAPFLSTVLTRRGVLLRNYFGTAHHSLGNYAAMISGRGPTRSQQGDCGIFSQLRGGDGCVAPAHVRTLAGQLDARGLRWRGYFEDMGTPCRHPALGAVDTTEAARPGDTYATKHNPFVYFHSVIDNAARCRRSVVDLSRLPADLRSVRTTPAFSLIVPGLCNDGHDAPCRDGRAGGLAAADTFLRSWVAVLERSPAFRRDGMIVVTFDEAEGTDAASSRACCARPPSPGAPLPGIGGPGGGRVGAVVLSPFARSGAVSRVPYDHYALLRTVESQFGLPRLGYAAAATTRTFGQDVFLPARR